MAGEYTLYFLTWHSSFRSILSDARSGCRVSSDNSVLVLARPLGLLLALPLLHSPSSHLEFLLPPCSLNRPYYSLSPFPPFRTAEAGAVEESIIVPGLYDILFAHCSPLDAEVSFSAEIVFKNPGDNYLAAGEQPLPILYLVEGLAFAAAFGVWFRYTRAHAADMHKLHHLMTMLVFAKVRGGAATKRPSATAAAYCGPVPSDFAISHIFARVYWCSSSLSPGYCSGLCTPYFTVSLSLCQ